MKSSKKSGLPKIEFNENKLVEQATSMMLELGIGFSANFMSSMECTTEQLELPNGRQAQIKVIIQCDTSEFDNFFTQYCNQQPVSGSNILSSKVCPDCGGTGTVVNYVAGCCRNPNKDGSCCNSPIPEPIQIQCCRCEATGYLKTTPAPVVNHEEVARKILDDLDDYLIDHPEGSRYKFGLPTESKFYLNQMLEIVKNNLKQITGK